MNFKNTNGETFTFDEMVDSVIECNNWGDRYWGVDKVGENILGKLLMKVRGN